MLPPPFKVVCDILLFWKRFCACDTGICKINFELNYARCKSITELIISARSALLTYRKTMQKGKKRAQSFLLSKRIFFDSSRFTAPASRLNLNISGSDELFRELPDRKSLPRPQPISCTSYDRIAGELLFHWDRQYYEIVGRCLKDQ